MVAGDLVTGEHDPRLGIASHDVAARIEPADQAGVGAVEHPQTAEGTGRNSARLWTRYSDTDRRAVHQRAVADGCGWVERSAADEATATADRYRQRVEHGTDPGSGIGRHLDVTPRAGAGVVDTQSDDHPLLRSSPDVRARRTSPLTAVSRTSSVADRWRYAWTRTGSSRTGDGLPPRLVDELWVTRPPECPRSSGAAAGTQYCRLQRFLCQNRAWPAYPGRLTTSPPRR